MADQFTVNWWEHLFDKTASKIPNSVKQQATTDETVVETPKEPEIKEKKAEPKSLLNNKSFYYSRFTKVKQKRTFTFINKV